MPRHLPDVGIISYGTYLPEFQITTVEIARAHHSIDFGPSLGIKSKTAPDFDEDTATISVEASLQAINRAVSYGFNPQSIEALFVGSESHPYAVKPTGTIVAAALGLGPKLAMADMQFACKAGTQALLTCLSYVKSNMAKTGLAIGADIAQSRPGDALEYTAGAGGAAFIIGIDHLLVKLVDTFSIATDTPDFWRRPHQIYPEHAGRFSREPAYFFHIKLAAQEVFSRLHVQPSDFDYCLFHTPNGKFPKAIASHLGFTENQLKHSLLVENIGNLYAASPMVGLAGLLDIAKNNQKIFMVSYGSGSGSDAFIWQTSNDLEQQRHRFKSLVRQQIKNQFINYQEYRQRIEI